MTKPLPRQSVFHLTVDEQQQVEQLIVNLNQQLEGQQGGIPFFREAKRLLVVGQVSDLVLHTVASHFQSAGYLVEPIYATYGNSAMLRLR